MTAPFEFDSQGGYRLSGRLERPEAAPRAWAILAHCFTCGKDSLAATRVSRALALNGIGVLRFDFAGLGSSGGVFADASFASDVADLVAAGQAMTDAGMAPSLLVGHSLGGAAVLAAAGAMPEIKAVATIGAPADVVHILLQFDPAALAVIEAEGEAEVQLGRRPFIVRRSFVKSARDQDLLECVAGLHRPLLVLHAPRDATVGIENAAQIFAAAKHPKSFISLDKADHLLTKQADADYAAAMIACWAQHYLAPLGADPSEPVTSPGVMAVETGEGRFALHVRAGSNEIIADEPESAGGTDRGFSPYELVGAGLAACTTMTMRAYAERKGMPLVRAATRVEHGRRAEGTPKDTFSRTIILDGPLDDEQRSRLLAIAERCPVDITLVRGSEIRTCLAVRQDDGALCDP